MLSQLKSAADRFAADTRGNVAMIFALAATTLTAAVGGGLDYSRSASIGAELQSALDSGVLAAASMSQTRSPDEVVRAYVEAAIGDHQGVMETLNLEVTSTVGFNLRQVDATASLSIPTTLLGVAGINTLTVGREARAQEQIRDIEISLVLDISGSMNGSKIRALRDAAEEFVQVVLADNPQRTSVSVIPYNGGVRLPSPVISSGLLDLPRGLLRQSACAEYGEEYPIQIDLTDVELEVLRWGNQPMFAGVSSSHCPERDEQAVFLSNDEADLISRIRGLDAGGNTGLDIATAWGARALDPVWRGRLGGDFSARPAAYTDEETIKVLVVMTDGAATAQYRRERRRGRWRTVELYSARTARENMGQACDEAEGKGVAIYTIAFQLNGNRNRNLMRDCASRPENFYPVEDMEIASAFSAIAADISQLRLSR